MKYFTVYNEYIRGYLQKYTAVYVVNELRGTRNSFHHTRLLNMEKHSELVEEKRSRPVFLNLCGTAAR